MTVVQDYGLAVAELIHQADDHWVVAVSAGGREVLRLWLEHDPGVSPAVGVLADALRCHGFLPYQPDLVRWVTDPDTTRIHLARSHTFG